MAEQHPEEAQKAELSRNYSPDVFFVPRHFRCWDDGGEGLIRRTTPPFPHCLIIFSKPVNC